MLTNHYLSFHVLVQPIPLRLLTDVLGYSMFRGLIV